jgi:hypothetical protein
MSMRRSFGWGVGLIYRHLRAKSNRRRRMQGGLMQEVEQATIGKPYQAKTTYIYSVLIHA